MSNDLLSKILAGKATPEELAEFGKKVAEQKIAQARNSAKQGARKEWREKQYKAFAEENDFELPEYPAELQ